MCSLKRKVDLTPIWDKPPLKRVKGVIKVYVPKERVYKEKNIKPFILYKRIVWKLTELNAHRVIDIEKRAFRQYDIDHKISIFYGFKHNIAPYCVADISNLRILDNKSNLLKNIDIFIDDDNKWIID